VSRLAEEKARAARVIADKPWPILASDTEVVVDGQIMGKPAGRDEAIAMLLSLSGRSHEVYSAVVLLRETPRHVLSVNRVSFKELSLEECRHYCDSGEPYDKAGGYGIQGRAAAFISGLEGSYSSVMGLPIKETAELLRAI
jgi:septum formation protein